MAAKIPDAAAPYTVTPESNRRMRHYRLHGVPCEVLAVVEQVPLWKVQEVCSGSILASEFEPLDATTSVIYECEEECISTTGRAAED